LISIVRTPESMDEVFIVRIRVKLHLPISIKNLGKILNSLSFGKGNSTLSSTFIRDLGQI